MSRSFRKYARMSIATGCNTEFYRDANRRIRAKARHIMDMLRSGHLDSDNLSFPTKHKDVQADEWYEPTDGSYLFSPREMERIKNEDPKLYRMLKNK